MEKKDSEEKKPQDVKLEHRYNYVGGHYAYKNSSKSGKRLDPENLTQLVLMTRPGQASKVNIAMPQEDERAGAYPQHNTTIISNEEDSTELAQDFHKTLELQQARVLDPYAHLNSIKSLKEAGFSERTCSLTKQRLDKVKAQFSHLSEFAFNQMLDIPRPDKRDFSVWIKPIEKNDQIIIAFPAQKTKRTTFAQVIQYDKDDNITGIKHCNFIEEEPLVINETAIDKFGNLRQIAHLGSKGDSVFYNAVERFDDGTVSWIITHKGQTGAAALRPDDQIVFVEDIMNPCTEVAARNLGAEGVEDGNWNGKFSPEACNSECNVMQQTFKEKVRKQIGQIVDGASIPGLDPVFWVEL